MTQEETAAAIARAVFERIATDGVCNSANIADAVFREMAFLAAQKRPAEAPTKGLDETRLRWAANELCIEVMRYIGPGTLHPHVDRAFAQLRYAIDELNNQHQHTAGPHQVLNGPPTPAAPANPVHGHHFSGGGPPPIFRPTRKPPKWTFQT